MFSRILLLVCLVFLGLQAYSQNILLRDINGTPLRIENYPNVEGSPYYPTDDWTEGYVVLAKSKQRIKDIKLKFNTYTNELIILKSNVPIVVTGVNEFGWQTTSQDSIKFRSVTIDGYKPGTFFQVLFIGENVLYKNISTTMIMVSAAYSDARKIDKFETTEKLLIHNSSGSFELKNKKDLKKALSAYGEKLDKLLEEKSISVKNEEEIIYALKRVEEK